MSIFAVSARARKVINDAGGARVDLPFRAFMSMSAL